MSVVKFLANTRIQGPLGSPSAVQELDCMSTSAEPGRIPESICLCLFPKDWGTSPAGAVTCVCIFLS